MLFVYLQGGSMVTPLTTPSEHSPLLNDCLNTTSPEDHHDKNNFLFWEEVQIPTSLRFSLLHHIFFSKHVKYQTTKCSFGTLKYMTAKPRVTIKLLF